MPKLKTAVDTVVFQLEQYLMNASKDQLHPANLQPIENAIQVLNKRAVMSIGGKNVTIIPDEDIVFEIAKDAPIVSVRASEDRSEDETEKYVSTKDVADYYGVTQETVRDWIEKHILPAERMGNRGRYKILREDFEFLKSKRERAADLSDETMKEVPTRSPSVRS